MGGWSITMYSPLARSPDCDGSDVAGASLRPLHPTNRGRIRKGVPHDHALPIQQDELLSPPHDGCRFRGWPWTVRELRAGQRSADAGSNRPYQSWPRGRRRWLSASEEKPRVLRLPIWRTGAERTLHAVRRERRDPRAAKVLALYELATEHALFLLSRLPT